TDRSQRCCLRRFCARRLSQTLRWKTLCSRCGYGQVLFSDVVTEGQGEARWVQASPTVDNGVVYIPNYGDGTVAAFWLNTPTPTPGPITLSARGKKVGGINTSRLTWSGANSANIDVNRDGVVIATTPNDGSYTDSTGTTGQANFTYKVCEAGSQS